MEEITYSKSIEGVRPKNLEGFFVGWKNSPSTKKHLALLQQSNHIVVAKIEGQIVGFVTAISDGVLSAYIPLLEVLPEYQGKGIGGKLVELLLEDLKDYYMIDLQCDKDLQSFYENLGMNKSLGMNLRNYDKQTGV